ncbi:hypothetical protein [Methylobacterium sp. Leaf88]|uniref:hypothetical protein n=1 Tax=Methylobacterium sp. Leaf88 TaxID=1736244 RepID=UPI000ABC9801|nr:hypothetical protein [Methylobacterium sp. Leaf88]
MPVRPSDVASAGAGHRSAPPSAIKTGDSDAMVHYRFDGPTVARQLRINRGA